MSTTETPRFRSPEEVAPGLGMTKTELRRYCRESGHFTKLSKNRVALDDENIEAVVAWVKEKKTQAAKIDPFV